MAELAKGKTGRSGRVLPTPGGRKLPTPGGKRQPVIPTPAVLPPTPAAVTTPHRKDVETPMSPDTPEQYRSQERQILQLTAQLEVARETALEAQKALIHAEGGQSKKTIETQMKLEEQTRDLAKANDKIKVLMANAESSKKEEEDGAAIKFRMESAKKRNEAQAIELGRAAANIEQMQSLLKDKEKIIEDYKEMLESNQERAIDATNIQAQLSACQGELTSTKLIVSDQNQFIMTLHNENGKLVEEIKRLKKQAMTRDKQLKESVEFAKNALIREKEKRTRLVEQQQQAKQQSR
eukprot:m.10651 g.10651  ORF g.10651 m.10651 type:complete len:294 (-) comp8429_c0_seq1:151-1032(-)